MLAAGITSERQLRRYFKDLRDVVVIKRWQNSTITYRVDLTTLEKTDHESVLDKFVEDQNAKSDSRAARAREAYRNRKLNIRPVRVKEWDFKCLVDYAQSRVPGELLRLHSKRSPHRYLQTDPILAVQ
jgi:hypothetical protein